MRHTAGKYPLQGIGCYVPLYIFEVMNNHTVAIRNNIFMAVVYFTLSLVISAWFIATKFWLYASVSAMIVSGAIAAAKWFIQLLAAMVLLKQNRWQFIRRMGFVCFAGSSLLLSYNLMFYLPLHLGGVTEFVLSLIIAVIAMIILYYRAVRQSRLPLIWFAGWLACLALAITLQLTIVDFNTF